MTTVMNDETYREIVKMKMKSATAADEDVMRMTATIILIFSAKEE